MEAIESPADFRRAVRLGHTTESLWLEFKTDVPRRGAHTADERRKGRLEFARDLVQFANTEGGCIILGVREDDRGGAKVAAAIEPLTDFDRVREAVERTVQEFVVPSTMSLRVVPLQLEAGLVAVINIPPQGQLVWTWDRQTGSIECLRRTNQGKSWMNPNEVEQHLMNGSRSTRLALTEAIERLGNSWDKSVDLASGVWLWRNRQPPLSSSFERQRARVFLGQLSEQEVLLRFPDEDAVGTPTLNVPYGLIDQAWVTSDAKLGLLLRARIVTDGGGRLGLEPR